MCIRDRCVSAQPAPRTVDDLYPLLAAAGCQPAGDADWWREHVSAPAVRAAGAVDARARDDALGALATAVERAVAPAVLRRTRASRGADGTPLVVLPRRVERVLRVTMSAAEAAQYMQLEAEARASVAALLREALVAPQSGGEPFALSLIHI